MMSEHSILFSHLGIYLSNVGKNIEIFGFSVAYYGIVIACGMVLAGAFVLRDAVRKGQKDDDYLDVVIASIVAGVLGARAYYVIFSWEMYRDNPISVLYFREGGLAIYGGIIGGIIGALITCRIKKLRFFDVADSGCMGVLIGQIMGRWGNFFNREAFGGYSDSLLSMQIPLSAVRSMDDVTPEMLSHLVNFGGIDFISVHPTFLYESLWNLGIFCFLFFKRYKRRFYGEIWFSYLGLYGLGRFWIEGLRTDSLLMPVLGLRVSQVLSLVLIVISIIYILYGNSKKKGETTC